MGQFWSAPVALLSPVLVSVMLSACRASPSSPNGFVFPSSGPLPTLYVGTVQDTLKGTGSVRVTETVVLGLASGYWDMTFSGLADPTRLVSGSLNGTTYNAEFSQGASADELFGCQFVLTASLTPSRLTGTYVSHSTRDCPDRSGTVDLTKQ